MKPRTLCACQPQTDIISARVAPLARPIICRIVAPLLSLGGAFFGAAFLPGLAGLLDCARGAVFVPLGAPFFRPPVFFAAAFSGVGDAPASATAAAVSWISLSIIIGSSSFLAPFRST